MIELQAPVADYKAKVDDALTLLNKHLTGRVYTDLDDALRNLLQSYELYKCIIEAQFHPSAHIKVTEV